MPTLPSRTPNRPWIPTAQAKPRPVYQQHAARSADYGTARWQKARLAHLQAHPCCVACTAKARTTEATVVDHIKSVRLGGGMWDTDNYQSLCRPCHQRKSAQERHQTPKTGVRGQNP